MNTCKSFFPKWLAIIFFFQFFVFVAISLKNDDHSLMYWSVLLIVLGLVLLTLKLKVSYNESFIEFKFSILQSKRIDCNEIDKIEVVKTSDFMGYGISISKKYGKAYILDTKEAVCIIKKNGERVTLSICDSVNFKKTLNISL